MISWIKQIRSPRVLHKVVAGACVAGQHDYSAVVLDAIAECGRHRAVVNIEHDDPNIAQRVLETLSNILRFDVDAGLREQFV